MKRPLCASLIVLTSLFVSASGQSQTPPTTPKPTPTPTPSQQPKEFPQATSQSRSPIDEQRPVYVTGTVELEDGTPLPLGVRVELVFGGRVIRQEYTRSDGSFVFNLSNSASRGYADASVSGLDDDFPGVGGFGGSMGGVSPRATGRVDLSGWEVRATLAGYTSEAIMLQSRSALDDPDVGVIVLRPLAQVKASTVSLNGLKAPKKARKHFETAQKAVLKKTPDHKKALSELQAALAEYPDYSAAWQMTGEIRLSQKDATGARNAFEKALATDDKYVNPYLALAGLDLQENRWAEAADLTSRLLALNPYVIHGHFLNAVANYNLRRYDLAEQAVLEVQKLDQKNAYPVAHYILGGIFANRGNLNGAAEEFKVFLKAEPNHPYADRVKQALLEWRQQGVPAAAEAASAPPTPPQN
jgi:hypothetical protein